ncbi:alpha/beta fold hydrolase [Streptantibioticus ferralitis]|uniref:Alpha/beta hydrolase n=1 Tax=Streptantibioticus ferralitis TaxID=236510 RepID=A0ABT5Z0J4_9ACTN|nr:alpha/beta hydrolase [Streptantibioticus ferralitis]MDF2257365.1 alpha/beta hydrolase [Streptantibioticus ferralitis]
MSNIVLVHGAWSDGSSWQEVIAALQDEGHRMLAVQLPLTSLEADIAWTQRQIATFDEPVTLVGHSYGGMVISAAAHQNAQVTALVFIAAYAPDESETIQMLSDRGAPTRGRAAIRFSEDGWSTIDPDLFGDALGADLPATTTRILAAVQKPTHSACFSRPSGRGAWHDLPCAYVLSVDDQILDPGLQRWFAERANATVTELPSSHLSMVSHPEEVAAAIGRMLRERMSRSRRCAG